MNDHRERIMAERISFQGTCPDCGGQADFWVITHDQVQVDTDETPCPISGCDGRIVWEEA